MKRKELVTHKLQTDIALFRRRLYVGYGAVPNGKADGLEGLEAIYLPTPRQAWNRAPQPMTNDVETSNVRGATSTANFWKLELDVKHVNQKSLYTY